MKLFKCQHCGQILYFENRSCENCGHRLGYVPERAALLAFEPEGELWRPVGEVDQRYRFCANAAWDACNWMIPSSYDDRFCLACRHNRTIPDLSIDENLLRWRKVEEAKHHLFYSLLRLDLTLVSREVAPEDGLAFDFLAEAPVAGDSAKVLTGHDNGVITLNLVEADDAIREERREAMGESYRTLLGHFRHEIGHYFWDRLVRDTDRLVACRACFGDEREDYGTKLSVYYADGPKADWQENFVSAYASAHPWEDFAETWAHYLHIVDTLEMACAYGMRLHPIVSDGDSLDSPRDFDPHGAEDIERLMEGWLPLTLAVNSINRCMGLPDLYPFVLAPPVIAKLGFVHKLLHAEL